MKILNFFNNFLNNIVKSLLNPLFLKITLLILFSFFVTYNLIFLVLYIKRKRNKGYEKPEGHVRKFEKFKEGFKNIIVNTLHINPSNKFFVFLKSKTTKITAKIFVINTLVIINPIIVLGMVGSFSGIIVPTPKVIYPLNPSLGVTEITNEKPVIVKFDRPIDEKNLRYKISPELKGEWKLISSMYGIKSSSLEFIPDETPKYDTRYSMSIEGIKNILGFEEKEFLFSFMTSSIPEIESITPQDGTDGILPGQEIIVVIDKPHENTAEFDFSITPEIPLDVVMDGDTKYTIKPKDGFKKSSQYKFEVSRTLTSYSYKTKEKKEISEKEVISTINFSTIEAPGINAYSPTGSGVMVDTNIIIEFKQDMNKSETEKAFSVNPNIEGAFSWEGERKLIFSPNGDLVKNTTYTVTVLKDAKAADDSPFEETFSFSFVTIGYVTVSGFYPGNNASGIGLGASVSVYFNQAVDHASAQSKFSISPNVAGNFSWSGNTMVYAHSGFAYSTRYSITIASGVKTVYGLDSVQAFGSSFTTRSQSTMLNVPSYAQGHMYSCMAVAARDALAYRGVHLSENAVLSMIGYDATPWSGTWGDPNAVWGNPNVGIVGNVDGAGGGINWGYGAYWGPVSSAISAYRSNEVKSGWNVQGIAQEIANGNPVIVWWVNGVWPAYEVHWKTPGGQSIRGVNSMHVQVVKGFTGTVANPTSFTVCDSGYGYPAQTYDVGTFAAKWSWFGNTAIVVR